MTIKLTHLLLSSLVCLLLSAVSAQADIIDFIATGSAGQGLLEGNINPPTGEAGTGGIGTTGIYFNTVNKLLHVDVEWGSGNGYVDLSQNVFKLHLHGPTADSFGAGFGQTAPLMITLSQHGSFDGSATGGGVNGNFFLDPAQEAALLAGKTYINVHLSDTDTGMIRGYLNPVPEPASGLVLGVAGLLVLTRRRQ